MVKQFAVNLAISLSLKLKRQLKNIQTDRENYFSPHLARVYIVLLQLIIGSNLFSENTAYSV